MNDAVKEHKTVLRLVQEHLTVFRLQEGAISEAMNLVDIFHHPTSPLPVLNTLSLRKNTVWVQPKELMTGFEKLKTYRRIPRIEYLDDLYPEQLGDLLQGLGLAVEYSLPLLVYHAGTQPFKVPSVLDGMHIDTVTDAQGSALWWYVWRNHFYDVVTSTADPVFIGQDLWKINSGTQVDLVMYRYRLPVGVARVNLNRENKTAQIVALTVMKEICTDASVWLLLSHAVQAALKHGCTLIFSTAQGDLYREHDFIDYGHVVCYAEKQKTACEETDIAVAQPISSL